MNGIVELLVRCILVVCGYVVGVLFASVFLNVITLPMLGFVPADAPPFFFPVGSLVITVPFVAFFIAYFAFVPAVVAILACEIIGLRDWLYYAIAGGCIGAFAASYFRGAFDADPAIVSGSSVMLAFVAAGICGGIGYWLVAGRSASGWRNRSDSITSPGPK